MEGKGVSNSVRSFCIFRRWLCLCRDAFSYFPVFVSSWFSLYVAIRLSFIHRKFPNPQKIKLDAVDRVEHKNFIWFWSSWITGCNFGCFDRNLFRPGDYKLKFYRLISSGGRGKAPNYLISIRWFGGRGNASTSERTRGLYYLILISLEACTGRHDSDRGKAA